MAVKSLSNIKAETGRDLTGLTNDNTLLFAETSNGTDGVATVAELTKGCMKETNGTVTGDHNFTGSLKVGGEDVLTEDDVTNTVENGNMFPVTSNAVNGAIGEAINVNYDANTSTSTENRKNAIDHILNTHPTAKLAIVRYYGGYYYNYEIFRMNALTYIIEIGFDLKCMVTWRSYNGTTQPLLNYFE